MKRSGARIFQTAIVVAAIAVSATRASATPLYAIELAFGDVQLSGSTPVSDTIGFHSGFEGTNFYSRTAFASAEPGRLRASSHAIIQLTPAVTIGLGSVNNGTDAAAAFRLDDVIIGGAGSTILTSLGLNLDGVLNTSAFAQLGSGIGAESLANAGVTIGVSLNGTTFRGDQSVASLWQVDSQSGGGSTFEDGLLTGFDGDSGFVTPLVLLPVGTPFTLVLNLSTSVDTTSRHAIVGSRRQAEASSQFAHTLSFPLSGPVFNLPNGYTVNSPSGLIVDNRWLGAAETPPVPEPSLLLLMGTGLCCLARRCSTRRNR